MERTAKKKPKIVIKVDERVAKYGQSWVQQLSVGCDSVIAVILFGCNRLNSVVQKTKSSSYGPSLVELVSTRLLLKERAGYVQ
jgi:hypothetical protein